MNHKHMRKRRIKKMRKTCETMAESIYSDPSSFWNDIEKEFGKPIQNLSLSEWGKISERLYNTEINFV